MGDCCNKEEQSLGFCVCVLYIVVNTQIGVNYLISVGNSVKAMTPLLD